MGMVCEKVFHILCTASIGYLKYFLFIAIKYHFDGKYMHGIFKRCFIFGNNNALTIGGLVN